jgi:predicted MPP superfamily phosphohydrolase
MKHKKSFKHFTIIIPDKQRYNRFCQNNPDVIAEDDPILNQRFPKELISQRLSKQKHHAALKFKDGIKFYWENFDAMIAILELGLKVTGQYRKGMHNTLQYTVVHNTFELKDLPSEFDGFRILHLSDLHIDGMIDHGQSLIEHIQPLEYDCCLITGDFRYLTYGQFHEALSLTKNLIKHIKHPDKIFGILGNHDYIEMVPSLETMGIKMLINESCLLSRGSATIGLAGIDDPHFYNTYDLKQALTGIETQPVKILMSHSQESIEEAAQWGYDIFLSGHTHGGQICLPGQKPLIVNTTMHTCVAGRWNFLQMQGYTSRGQGSSGLPVRFHCPPEITVHTLKSQTENNQTNSA